MDKEFTCVKYIFKECGANILCPAKMNKIRRLLILGRDEKDYLMNIYNYIDDEDKMM